jgi:hypothetical protein
MTSDTNPANDEMRDSINVYYPTAVEEPNSELLLPRTFVLEGGRPEPFADHTLIHYALPRQCRVSLRVFNSVGVLVRTLVNRDQTAGFYSIVWDGSDDARRPLGHGVYHCVLTAGGWRATHKMTRLQ